MKKLLSVLLILSMLLLCACGLMTPERSGLVEIEGFDTGCESVFCTDFAGDRMVALTSNKRSETDFYFGLSLVDTQTAKVIKSVDLSDCGLENLERAEFMEDGRIKVSYPYEKKYLLFSPELEQIGGVETDAEEDKTGFEDNRFFDGSVSVYGDCMQYFADFNNNDLVNAIGFKGENDTLYFTREERFTPFTAFGKRVLGTYPNGDTNTETVSVFDYETGTVINRFTTALEEGMSSVYVTTGNIGEHAAFISMEYGDGDPEHGHYYNKFYLWYYEGAAKNEPFQTETFTYDSLKAENDRIIGSIKNAYGINTYIDKENEYEPADDETYGYTFGTSPLKAYVLLREIDAFLGLLPRGFVKEMYQGFNEIVQEFNIYIVNDIKSTSSAYANGFTDKYYITFESYSVLPETVYHEFMHIMERRVFEYYEAQGEDFDVLWYQYNPKDFDYIGYDSSADIHFEEYEDSFATFYGMNAATEDRADMFMGMLAAGLEGRAPYWYKKGTPLAEKAQFLAKAIRAAYPSMKDAPPQPWEKYLD